MEGLRSRTAPQGRTGAKCPYATLARENKRAAAKAKAGAEQEMISMGEGLNDDWQKLSLQNFQTVQSAAWASSNKAEDT